jgi:phage-related protein
VTHFQAVYYRDSHGREPVREFVESLADEVQAALDNQIDRLNLLSDEIPHLPFPHSSQVAGELRELRCHFGRHLYRILYQRSHRLLILLHMFGKRTSKIPQSEIRVAQRRWEDFKARMDAVVRTPPRAAGHDAP